MDGTSRGWRLSPGHQRGPHVAPSGALATADSLECLADLPPIKRRRHLGTTMPSSSCSRLRLKQRGACDQQEDLGNGGTVQ